MKNEVLCMYSHLIKIKNTHFHIIIHSINTNGNYASDFIYMFIRSQYTHASLPKCQYQTKKSRISKMKNIVHIRAFMHLPHFLF